MTAKNRRKRLPYAIGGLLDSALMANAAALHALEPIIEGRRLDPLEESQRITRVVHEIHTNDRALREIQQAGNE